MNNETSAQNESGNATGFVVKPTSDSHFAWIRTRLSADSMLMGWMRLATTLIGFGFAIVQFFDRLETMSSAKPALAPHVPRYLGLALIFSGVFGLLIAIWQYVWRCHIEQVEAVIDRGEARLRHWNRVAGLSPGRQ